MDQRRNKLEEGVTSAALPSPEVQARFKSKKLFQLSKLSLTPRAWIRESSKAHLGSGMTRGLLTMSWEGDPMHRG